MGKRTNQRIYVKICSDFDATGYMQPRSIILGRWAHLSD